MTKKLGKTQKCQNWNQGYLGSNIIIIISTTSIASNTRLTALVQDHITRQYYLVMHLHTETNQATQNKMSREEIYVDDS